MLLIYFCTFTLITIAQKIDFSSCHASVCNKDNSEYNGLSRSGIYVIFGSSDRLVTTPPPNDAVLGNSHITQLHISVVQEPSNQNSMAVLKPDAVGKNTFERNFST